MVIFQYKLYIFGIHLWTVLYPKPCYNEQCYKVVVVYFCWKKCECKSYSHFFQQKKTKNKKKKRELGSVLTRTVTILITNELVKLTMLWTADFLFSPWKHVMVSSINNIFLWRNNNNIFEAILKSTYLQHIFFGGKYCIRPNYRTCPYKRTVKKLRSL